MENWREVDQRPIRSIQRGGYIMGFFWGLIVGGVVGVFVMGLLAGGTQNEKLEQTFDDGFNAGKQSK